MFALTDSGEIWRYDEAYRSWSDIPLPTEEPVKFTFKSVEDEAAE